VVGDDDQSIYQWRGSDVANIVNFERRYSNVASFKLMTNRRSRPKIIEAANAFAATITGRLPKTMEPHRPSAEPEIVAWRAPTEADEADVIANTILQLRGRGYRYRDIAVLVRSSTSYTRLLEALGRNNVLVQPAGRTGLFREADAQTFGRTFSYLAGNGWRSEQYGNFGKPVRVNDLIAEYVDRFQLDVGGRRRVEKRLLGWKKEADNPTGPASLVGSYYDLLGDCGVEHWNFDDPIMIARLGSLARCSAILADYESVRRRARRDESSPGETVGGQDRGAWYYTGLAIHIQNWALGAFEGFEGEEDFTLDAVDLTTVHKAKGLEWPAVFVPCVSAKRFPSSNTGKEQNWHVPHTLFDRARYEGTQNDERRLFYVAVTRARDWLSISTHDTPNKRAVEPSPFLIKLAGGLPANRRILPLPPPIETADETEDLLSITFSELANYKACALSYRLRNLIGFQPSLAPELGYGKAVHHIMRNVAEYTRGHRKPPTPDQLDLMFDADFYLPAANKAGHRQMKEAARKLVDKYIAEYGDDLKRVWAIERPFELHLSNAVIIGRADVILDEEDGEISSLAVVDYKTAADPYAEHESQLQIYADAGRREGLNVRAAYLHDLKAGERSQVDVSKQCLEKTEAEVIALVDRLKARQFEPHPGPACQRCDVRAICRFAE
jgi:DNA helicase-2/ATP-dependent DNA helicase PcrA